MSREQLAEELDRNIDAMMENPSVKPPKPDSLLPIAADLRLLPTEDFRISLRHQLMEQAEAALRQHVFYAASEVLPSLSAESLPSFSARQVAVLPADPRSLFFSFLSHAAVIALIASGIWYSHKTVFDDHSRLADLIYTPLAGNKGGGGSGDHSRIQASYGTPPPFSNTQLAPPAIVVRSEPPKLPVESTVLGPPDLKLPQSKQIGDLLSRNLVIPSNGTGGGGGIGESSGTGDGSGTGGGVGIGSKAGFGGGVLLPGPGVSAPQVIFKPDPEYSDEARRVKYQGNVVLSLIVDPMGKVREIHVARSLGMGLDEKAVEAVRKWRFSPGMKDGHPVAVQVNVEVNFRLY